MSGYTYGSYEPTEKCPYCNEVCTADFVDIGVGFTQCGPFHCQECGASEIGPHDKDRDLTADEARTRWYGPGRPPSEHANMRNGRIVPHQEMRAVYRAEFTGNPLGLDPDYVAAWYANHRNAAQPAPNDGQESEPADG